LPRTKKITQDIILRILQTAKNGGEGHVPSSLSILNILEVLYAYYIKKNGDNKFILSKGHGCISLYAILEKYKFIKNINTFCKFNSNFGGHPDSNKINGIETSTGSLGHGFPFGIGLAMAKKIKNERGKIITLIGDGECNEGTIWESCLLASHHSLNNLICIVDHNKSTNRALKVDDLNKKFSSFGWQTLSINGHNKNQIFKALKKQQKKPFAIIANTIKGKGIKFMENNPEWHHKKIDKKTIEKYILETIK
jgi:transketolase|tara:strand:+ start:422 stop:1177 length:756 start_codon:yes stop_codon:yes gene_type:complete